MVVKHSEINVTYCDGYILEFDKVNVHAIIPNMLVFNKNWDYLTVLRYDEYHEYDDLFFVDGEKYSLKAIKNILEIIKNKC